MQYEVEIAGRLLQVAVTRAGDGFAVTVDGRTHRVDAARIDAHTLSLLVDRVWSKEVSIAADPVGGQLGVHVGATPVSVTLNGRRRWGRKDEGAGTASGGPQRLVAPMPGKVVRVLVTEGQEVAEGAPLVVLEAMKMEHTVRAAAAGVVRAIHVVAGDQVDRDRVLAVVTA